jgi:RNA polymerase sigma-70 factor (ECF subfamily)
LLDTAGVLPEPDLEATAGLDSASELALLKGRDRDHVRAALEATILALPARERTLLRMHHVDGYTLDRLATIHHVHRATVARWLAAARAQIVEGVRDRLGAALRLSPAEIDRLVADVDSQLELSLSRLFG